jgi:hypothetical protein
MKGYSIFLKLIVSISLGMTISSLVGAISRIQINEAKSRSYDTFQEHRELLRRGSRQFRKEVNVLGKRLLLVDQKSWSAIYREMTTSSKDPSNNVRK